ncbi:MAG: DUF2304 family protein [Candidatus Eisenbacteria bacterium]|nr:DUF2304 family protein [Candidatus Latescibacterota bacterium]MBD3301082.1 DUF2304 family protein [Candidatus Eisenbacteria bacterium]
MTLSARIFVVGLSLLLFLTVLRMARRRALGIEYSILWLVLTGFGVLAGLGVRQADALSRLIGIDYPPAFFFLICIVVLLSIVLHLTIRLSRLADAQRDLAQEIALLRAGASAPEEERDGEPDRR